MISMLLHPFRAAGLGLLLVTAGVALAAPSSGQTQPGGEPPEATKIVHPTVAPVELRAGATGEAWIELAIEEPWHINANPPSPDYMIPTQATLPAASGVTPGTPAYPPAHQLKVDFDDQPLAVYDRTATIRLPLRAAPDAPNGRHVLRGSIRFQACNDQVCLAPATIPFEVVVTVTGGAAAVADTTVASTVSADTANSASRDTAAVGVATPIRSVGGSSITSNAVGAAITRGGFIGFITLFVIGLFLNLTPCVYPMLGVTVSIFGARGAASMLQAFGSALLYVLGMVVMYSSLGVAAALTGGLFGSFLQNPVVLTSIGVLFLAMSLSMFGVYELQPPAWLLTRLGGSGATSAIGLFLSGLVVGVFAAPCVGPPVVALLAIVGAKADPWFGFVTFATLALGLGLPYLVLGTFSGLLRRLPRSGEWMVWVKSLFGVVLATVGLYFASLALAPQLTMWIVAAAAILGGVYLGFFEKSAAGRRGFTMFKRAHGLATIAAGVWIITTIPTKSLEFQPYDAGLVQQALASGKPVILDFSADWCIPCHELERNTFSDARVIAAARGFAAFQVDLTHSDSPEVQARVKEFKIQGVPTVVFLAPDGREVENARFSGFLPAGHFLERLRLVAGPGRES